MKGAAVLHRGHRAKFQQEQVSEIADYQQVVWRMALHGTRVPRDPAQPLIGL